MISSKLPDLDAKCGQHFRYRDFIECGDTWKREQPANVPQELQTYAALEMLANNVLDPIIEEFGGVELTYGVATSALSRKIKSSIAPALDQHAGHERSQSGRRICDRDGVAIDFRVLGCGSLIVARWLVTNTSFDRLYYYGDDRPLHVSVSPNSKRQCTVVRRNLDGSVTPSTYTIERFLEVVVGDTK